MLQWTLQPWALAKAVPSESILPPCWVALRRLWHSPAAALEEGFGEAAQKLEGAGPSVQAEVSNGAEHMADAAVKDVPEAASNVGEAAEDEAFGWVGYLNAVEAAADVKLEGGRGDPVLFWKVKPEGAAWKKGARPGDELVMLNGLDRRVLLERPADDILPLVQGPLALCWRKRSATAEAAKTRLHRRRPRNWEELQDDGLWREEHPVSRTKALVPGLWCCGSCGCRNLDRQEHCRRCGLRDTRLPPRVGPMIMHETDHVEAPLLFPPEGITAEDVRQAAVAGYQEQ
eukprot:TRINITY_DN90674_c0_g1_i1.p1 TRINITY_DN90674_c0_g1~~TRINITY_DN90674_c0_g1_i1.p1  ORF type:complete len:287 (+),score=58.13 TRINITY_DN90674_c0_g1_i1:59-919(+)